MRREDQTRRERRAGLGLVQLVHLPQPIHPRHLEVIGAVLAFVLQEDVPVIHFVHPADVLEVRDFLQRHEDPFDAVGDFHRRDRQLESSGLLKVGELGDLHPVQPDFPSQAPGAQRRRLPVVLHEADVVIPQVDPERRE